MNDPRDKLSESQLSQLAYLSQTLVRHPKRAMHFLDILPEPDPLLAPIVSEMCYMASVGAPYMGDSVAAIYLRVSLACFARDYYWELERANRRRKGRRV